MPRRGSPHSGSRRRRGASGSAGGRGRPAASPPHRVPASDCSPDRRCRSATCPAGLGRFRPPAPRSGRPPPGWRPSRASCRRPPRRNRGCRPRPRRQAPAASQKPKKAPIASRAWQSSSFSLLHGCEVDRADRWRDRRRVVWKSRPGIPPRPVRTAARSRRLSGDRRRATLAGKPIARLGFVLYTPRRLRDEDPLRCGSGRRRLCGWQGRGGMTA